MVITDGSDIKLTKNFRLTEFYCHCDKCHVEVDMELTQKLQILRDLLGDPITIAVGYRCPEHNAKVLNADPNSWHKYGKAADIKSSKHTPEEIFSSQSWLQWYRSLRYLGARRCWTRRVQHLGQARKE